MSMERAAWTDERLDDLAASIRTGFARTEEDMRSLHEDMRALRAEVQAGDRSLRLAAESGDQSVQAEMREGFRELRGEIRELRRITMGVGGGIIVTLIAAVVTGGI
jgi:hypothetical protein